MVKHLLIIALSIQMATLRYILRRDVAEMHSDYHDLAASNDNLPDISKTSIYGHPLIKNVNI